MTHPYVCYDSSICVQWRIHTQSITHSRVIFEVTVESALSNILYLLIHMCDMTHSCGKRLIHMLSITHSHVIFEATVTSESLQCVASCCSALQCVAVCCSIHAGHHSFTCDL